MNQKAWRILNIILSIIIAVIGLGITANIFDKYNLPFLNSWALMHGTFLIIYPLYAATTYYLMNFLLERFIAIPEFDRKEKKLSKVAVLSLLLSSIGMLIPFLGIGGIIAGHSSRSQCKKLPNLRGSGLALFGLILGYFSVAFHGYVIVAVWYASKISR